MPDYSRRKFFAQTQKQSVALFIIANNPAITANLHWH